MVSRDVVFIENIFPFVKNVEVHDEPITVVNQTGKDECLPNKRSRRRVLKPFFGKIIFYPTKIQIQC